MQKSMEEFVSEVEAVADFNGESPTHEWWVGYAHSAIEAESHALADDLLTGESELDVKAAADRIMLLATLYHAAYEKPQQVAKDLAENSLSAYMQA